jgi:hypothetical protein
MVEEEYWPPQITRRQKLKNTWAYYWTNYISWYGEALLAYILGCTLLTVLWGFYLTGGLKIAGPTWTSKWEDDMHFWR